MAIDPYKILNVPKTATQDEIKAAYRKLAKKFHPDLNPGNKTAEAKFKEINGAYALIDTVENRAKFDRGETEEAAGFHGGPQRGPFYSKTQNGGGRYSSQFGGFDADIFADIFSNIGRAGGGGVHEPEPQEVYQLSIAFRDAILGAEKEITFPNGKKFQVKIPPGVDSGTRLRFAGKGEHGADVFVELHVAPSKDFQRSGADLETEVKVPFDKAILGGEIQVPTVEGSILLKIPANVKMGQKMRVGGKGVPQKGGARGALIVKLNLQMPEKVDEEFKQAVAAWSARQQPEAATREKSV